MFNNTTIEYDGHEYEIFWTSQDARHICQNYHAADKLHDLHHEEIVTALERKSFVQDVGKGRCTFLTKYWDRVYETHVYLKQGTANRPGRCVIKSCCRSNKIDYLRLFAA
ncbi:hypothetical protein ACVWYF_000368 [Hymenobacter sp. UYAg731]